MKTIFYTYFLLLCAIVFIYSCKPEEQQKIVSAPIADFTVQGIQAAQELLTFTNLTPTADSYYWNFGDGTTSILPNPQHSYTQTGVYKVVLVVANAAGSNQKEVWLTIDAALPRADFDFGSLQCELIAHRFKNKSQNAAQYVWNFGDGSSSQDSVPTHIYIPGTYTVTLTASRGTLTHSTSKTVTIDPFPNVSGVYNLAGTLYSNTWGTTTPIASFSSAITQNGINLTGTDFSGFFLNYDTTKQAFHFTNSDHDDLFFYAPDSITIMRLRSASHGPDITKLRGKKP
jgi:PKD repeat protein